MSNADYDCSARYRQLQFVLANNDCWKCCIWSLGALIAHVQTHAYSIPTPTASADVSEADAQFTANQPTLKQRAQMRSIMETNEVSFDSGYEDEDKVE